MKTDHSNHTATLLNSGTVLITGGNSLASFLASAELYDPATGIFSLTGSMNTARAGHTATLLNSGNVLVAAGDQANFSSTASADLYELVGLSLTSLSFSNQVIVTTSASQTVQVTNNQSTALSITSVAIGGTNASDFAETDNCVGNVSAGGSCSINVTFTPAAIGSRTGNLNIANNISGSPLTVPLCSFCLSFRWSNDVRMWQRTHRTSGNASGHLPSDGVRHFHLGFNQADT
jgi:hypothetical protein